MNNSRRAILKLLGSVPVAAPSAITQLTAMMASPAVAALGALGVQGQAMPEAYSPLRKALGVDVGRQIEKLMRRAEDETYAKGLLRIGGLDADIAALKSVSTVSKARMQADRNTEEYNVIQHIKELGWW